MFKCDKCNNELEHVNNENWICDHCLRIIVIPVTKNWISIRKEKIDNKFYLWEKGNNVIEHQIPNKPNAMINYLDFITDNTGGILNE